LLGPAKIGRSSKYGGRSSQSVDPKSPKTNGDPTTKQIKDLPPELRADAKKRGEADRRRL